ncbi:Hsp90 cochaperone [Orbilia oligospora]|uniref:Hsp90 cochaperone n=1 Tax=Orbilia oligospora TaxID=2813651 RepID=A0A7C8P464_ORBOL|nr:Hsp90 cochaperone [Orbilia oligospora]KAF3092191.1 Hsp90 cochaperone [Orbilia oligospora]KAF3130442.1 Hsp90 cochaperone [Orbilia oligospora]KAF3147807.1 Hsp90 cochaperone [Orbilia oligospora]KAF3170079.1 Hsp90 cochaperone [Orbilia oligospora]
MADALKAQGNAAFSAKDFPKAIDLFSQAIEIDPTNHVLFSNRSGSHASLKNFDEALKDATKCTEIKPDWSKGWSRKGAALHGTGDLIGAIDAYEEALKLDANNATAKQGLSSVHEAIRREQERDGVRGPPGGGPGGMGLDSLFSDPMLIPKLAANPKTRDLVQDPEVLAKLQRLKQNPADFQSVLGDPQMMTILAAILGISDQRPGASEEDTPMYDAAPPPPRSKTPPPPPQPQKEPTPEPEDPEAVAKREAKEAADKEKALGNDAYKKRNFPVAIEHYNKAWELHKDITYLNNLAAAKFEAGDYEGCIADCEKAITEGREVFADFKLIAKAYGRIGTAYHKLNDLSKAIEYYQRSLTEHRTPDILTKLRTVEKLKVQSEKEAYISPEKAEEARLEGNEKFKNADWPGAVEAYTEMIKRSPSDARGYTNRAAALQKLMSFPSSIDDCRKAIELDPGFMRAHIRLAQGYFGLKEYNKVLDALAAATEADRELKHTREIEELSQKTMGIMYTAHENETEEQARERIQRDPEIVSIISDPIMQTILNQAKNDPMALQEHMRNPTVRTKIQKLIAAGVIRLGR